MTNRRINNNNFYPNGISGISTSGMPYQTFFDVLLAQDNRTSNYPPYNLIRRGESSEGNEFLIEVAVAGFFEKELEVTYDNNELTITGVKLYNNYKDTDYITKGIATRNFELKFRCDPTIEAKGAHLKSNGILMIELLKRLPEKKLPNKIKIQSGDNELRHPAANAVDRTLLSESKV